ncbi:MAG TPA: heterodisulfide reductase-related iron-sulfur binding cluster [Mycobacteriales bacterium]|nr:heterodisulfide reductase-related iron-sulfur binding cluster [Mycobacteriales bacterium]
MASDRPAGTGAFDAHHPPPRELVDDCVHCGFCLPTCPTYLLWGEEMDSPRGRIHLMKTALEGEPLPSMVPHFDQCLGCMACVTACPSGVQYDRLIEATRAQVERRHPRSRRERALRAAVFSLFPYPRRLRALRPLVRAYQRTGAERLAQRLPLPPTLAAMRQLLPPVTETRPLPEVTSPVGARRARVGLLLGCVQREFFAGVNAATARVLAAEGCEVVAPEIQGCCGALSVHMGREGEAIGFAQRLVATFERYDVDAIVVNAAGCGSAMKDYGWVLRDEPGWRERAEAFSAKVRDVSEWLMELGPAAVRHPLEVTVAYHDACHLAHAQGVRAQPRSLLGAIPGLRLREIGEPEICCGSAGVYNLLQPDTARELGDRKAAHVAATGADLLVTANPGCLMQVHSALRRRGESMRLAHPVEVLDASLRGLPAASIGRSPASPPPAGTGLRRRRKSLPGHSPVS